MSRRLVVVLMSDLFDHFGEAFMSRMLKSKTGSRQQIVARLIIPVSITNMERVLGSKPLKPPKSTTKLVTKVFKRNSKTKSVDEPAIQRYPSADGVARAYKLLSRIYAPGDEIILIGISGLREDGLVIKDTIAALVNHLDSGTEPVIPSHPISPPARETFCFEAPMNLLVGRSTAASSVTLIHRTGDNDVSGYSANISKQYPLSVKRLVSINWATGHESACHILRGRTGEIVAREMTFFEDQGWHGNMIIFSTMSYIWYELGATAYWANVVPIKKMSVPTSMLPASMRLENTTTTSSSPMDTSEIESRRDSISSSHSGTSETRSSISGSSRSSISLNSDWERSNAKTSSPNSSVWQFASFPTTLEFSAPTYTASPPTSQASTPTSSAFTSRTSTLFTLNEPILKDSPKPVAMSKHEVLTYNAFGSRREDWFLPARVIWKSL